MKLLAKALALSTFCLTAASCGQQKVVEALPPPPERLQCAALGSRPAIPPEYVIDWSKVTTVAQAHAEHDAYVRSVRTREGIISGYILEIEGKLFVCSNNAAWLREFYKEVSNGG